MKTKILFVEDDTGLVFTLKDRLESEGYEVTNIDNGNHVIKQLLSEDFELILLDIMLKGKNGIDVCYEIRSRGIKIPIIMLTAKGETTDKVTGLKIGADDYITKPFDISELLARIQALLRRNTISASLIDTFKFGNIEINFQNIEVFKNKQKIEFSQKEFQLLKYLILNRNRLITRDELLNEVWGYEDSPTTRTVDTHIGWLRQKLENNPKDPKFIITVHGFGYKFIDQ